MSKDPKYNDASHSTVSKASTEVLNYKIILMGIGHLWLSYKVKQ